MHCWAASRSRCTVCSPPRGPRRDAPGDLVVLELGETVDHQVGPLDDPMEMDHRGVDLDALEDRDRAVGDCRCTTGSATSAKSRCR